MTQSKLHPYQRKALALCFAIALLSFPCTVQAFSAAAGPAKSQRAAAAAAATSQTRLHAWTLPNGMTGSHSNGLGMFKATWYDDHHPTARKVVYNDDDQTELFRFVVPFSSSERWSASSASSVFEEPVESSTIVFAKPRRRLRSAATWAINRIRRIAA